jgi:hypothetical protein
MAGFGKTSKPVHPLTVRDNDVDSSLGEHIYRYSFNIGALFAGAHGR